MKRIIPAITASLLTLVSLACSSSGSVAPEGSDGPAATDHETCSHLCEKVDVATFNAACGAATKFVLDSEHPPASSGDVAIDLCSYGGGEGESGLAMRMCFSPGPDAANSYRDFRVNEGPGVEISGLGDEAFYREKLASRQVDLYARRGLVVVQVHVEALPVETAPGTMKDCLVTMASAVLAAR